MARPNFINRDYYRKLRSMSREKLEETFYEVYESGVRDALENSVINLDMEKLRNDLGSVSGIGEKRLEQIMEIIQRNISEADNQNSQNN